MSEKKEYTFTVMMNEKEKRCLDELLLKKGFDKVGFLFMAALRTYQTMWSLIDQGQPVVMGTRLSKLTGDTKLNQLSGDSLETALTNEWKV